MLTTDCRSGKSKRKKDEKNVHQKLCVYVIKCYVCAVKLRTIQSIFHFEKTIIAKTSCHISGYTSLFSLFSPRLFRRLRSYSPKTYGCRVLYVGNRFGVFAQGAVTLRSRTTKQINDLYEQHPERMRHEAIGKQWWKCVKMTKRKSCRVAKLQIVYFMRVLLTQAHIMLTDN